MDDKIPQILREENISTPDEISRKKLVNIVSDKHSLGIALQIDIKGHVFVADIQKDTPIYNSGCFNVSLYYF